VVKAVIDVGSNSVLLLVAEQIAGVWKAIYEDSYVTALGEGTKSTGLIKPDRAEATLAALTTAYQKAHEFGATDVLAGGTMALRIARNARDFQDKAEAQDTPVCIVSGNAEAQLGFLAVAEDPLFADHERLAIVDPGGHSTELMIADHVNGAWDVAFRHSFPVGTLGLKDLYLKDETPGFEARMTALKELDTILASQDIPEPCGSLVVLGAAGTNLVSVREKLPTWQPDKVHGATLSLEEVSRAVGWLFDMTDAQRAAVPGMEKGRERTIHVGSLILERFMNRLHVEACTVSVRGWRYALLNHQLSEIEAGF